jgi:hypothetical protein
MVQGRVAVACVRRGSGPHGSRRIPVRLLRFRLGSDTSPAPSVQALHTGRSAAFPRTAHPFHGLCDGRKWQQPAPGPGVGPCPRLARQVVLHQHVGMQDYPVPADQFPQQLDEMRPVAVVPEKVTPPHPPGRDMLPPAPHIAP